MPYSKYGYLRKISALAICFLVTLSSIAPSKASNSNDVSFEGGPVGYSRGDTAVNLEGDLTILRQPEDYEYDNSSYYLVDAQDENKFFDCSIGGYELPTDDNSTLNNPGKYYLTGYCGIDEAAARNSSGIYNFAIAYTTKRNQYKYLTLISALSLPVLKSTSRTLLVSKNPAVSGDKITITPQLHSDWSDGVETYECIDGATLQYRPVGTSRWITPNTFEDKGEISGCPQVLEGIVAEPADYRLNFRGSITESKFLAVAKPSNARLISPTESALSSVISGSVVNFSANMKTQYDDGVWRDSVKGSNYQLEFCPVGASAWLTIAASSVTATGKLSIRVPVQQNGNWRFSSNGATSTSVAVTLITPTSVVAMDSPSLPTSVISGAFFTISNGVSVQYSDGIYRDAPIGTNYAVQFSQFNPTDARTDGSHVRQNLNANKKARWVTVRSGKIAVRGKIAARIRAEKSGFWRIKIGKTFSVPKRLVVRKRP